MRKWLAITAVLLANCVLLIGCGSFFQFHVINGNGNARNGITGETVFFDDFNGGARGEWFAKSGNLAVDNGRLVGGGEFYVRTSESPSWRKYAIGLDVLELSGTGSFLVDPSVSVLVRSPEIGKGIRITLFHDGIEWRAFGPDWEEGGEFQDGSEWLDVSLTGEVRVKIEAIGNRFNIHVRQSEEGAMVHVGSFTDNTYNHGMPGVSIRTVSWPALNIQNPNVDNVRVTSP